tara:strand:- start:104 stop:334 length:231 start_codon:yes stop_codon:yes gene_type:complete
MTHNPTHVGCDPILAVVIVIVVVLQKKITGGIYYTITEGTSEGTKEKKINIYYLNIKFIMFMHTRKLLLKKYKRAK